MVNMLVYSKCWKVLVSGNLLGYLMGKELMLGKYYCVTCYNTSCFRKIAHETSKICHNWTYIPSYLSVQFPYVVDRGFDVRFQVFSSGAKGMARSNIFRIRTYKMIYLCYF